MRKVYGLLSSTLWISLSEFVRNEFLVQSDWVTHYQKMGLQFPNAPINGMVWGIWAFCMSILIQSLIKKYSVIETVIITWFTCFVMMWLVIGNLHVLPLGILGLAIPLSLLECFIATLLIRKFTPLYE